MSARESVWVVELAECEGFSRVSLGRRGVLGRGCFTLARWLLTLAHWAGTVLQHITISIWHCLLRLMPTHTNTHTRLCANNTRQHTSQPQAPWDPSTGYWQSRRLVPVQDRYREGKTASRRRARTEFQLLRRRRHGATLTPLASNTQETEKKKMKMRSVKGF